MSLVSRYHPLLVALHWLMALMISVSLVVGFLVLAETSNIDPGKIAVLRVHMAVGMAILALMLLRFVVRMRSRRPPEATTGNAKLDRAAPLTHYGFYLVVVFVTLSGFTTAIVAGLPAIVFGGSGEPLPPDFDVFLPKAAHAFWAWVLLALIALHLLAALYHQFVRKDGLLARMSFGRRE